MRFPPGISANVLCSPKLPHRSSLEPAAFPAAADWTPPIRGPWIKAVPPSPRRIPGEGPPVEVPMQSVMFAEAPGGVRRSFYFRGGTLFSWGGVFIIIPPCGFGTRGKDERG